MANLKNYQGTKGIGKTQKLTTRLTRSKTNRRGGYK